MHGSLTTSRMRKTITISVLLLLFSLASFSQSKQEWKDSVSVLITKIEQNPKSIELRMRKAECNIMLEQWEYARDEYSKILEMHENHIGALYFRGFVNTKLHRYTHAEADYQQVLRIEPGHKNTMIALAMVYLEEGNTARAFDESNHLVELYPEDAMSYSIRSQVECSTGSYELALEDISKAIELEEKALSEDSVTDEYKTFVLDKIEILRKLGKSDSDSSIQQCARLLTSKGVPSYLIFKAKRGGVVQNIRK